MWWWLLGLWLASPAVVPFLWLVGRLTRALEARREGIAESHAMIDRPEPWSDWLVVLGCAAAVLAVATVPN
jgi:hypothetical protein